MDTREVDVRQKEYDRFGPWVTEISEEDPVPPLFVPYLDDQEKVLFSFKIPRDIERRQASPEMDLYDYLVSVYEDQLVILKREGSSVGTERCKYEEIQMIHFIEDLLDGRVQLVLPGGTVELPFNSVSSDAMKRLISQIRKRYGKETSVNVAEPVGTEATRGLSFYFQNYQKTFAADHPEFVLCASQAETRIGHAETSGVRRFVFGIIGRYITESMHFSDGRELIVMHHGRQYRYFRRPLYAQHTTYLPVERVAAVRWEDDSSNEAIVHLTLGTDLETFTMGFTRDNASRESYSVYLSKVLQPDPR